ncbi:MAG: aminoacyl-tRNA deacylase [Acidimicrobiia bacterium]
MPNPPATSATAALDAAEVAYRMVHHGHVSSAEEAAEKRGIPIGALAKTLVIRIAEGEYVLVLVPGNKGLDYPKLRAHLGTRRLSMPSPDEAKEATGYARGTITPLGAGGWPVILDESFGAHPEISLGAGVGEWAIHLSPADLVKATNATLADIADS